MNLTQRSRSVDWLSIDLVNQEARKQSQARAMTIEERTKRALAKGEKLLAEAHLAQRLSTRG
jgi:hypothetical protein